MTFTHVYVCEVGGLVKVGATRNVKQRMAGLAFGLTSKPRLVRSWELAQAAVVERLALQSLREHLADGRESFRCSVDAAVAAVEQAITRARRGERPTKYKQKSKSRKQKAAEAAEIALVMERGRRTMDEFNQWAAEHPAELEAMLAKMKS